MTEHSTAMCCFLPNKVQQLFSFINNLRRQHPIYPLDPIAPEHSEFFLIDTKFRIRIIHVIPESGKKYPHTSFNYELNVTNKRNSLAEEYWFTKWNKPLKVGHICNCSFRKSYRLSTFTNPINRSTRNEENRDSINLPTRITNVESFVERILQETIFEAFQEYYMIKANPKIGGNVNFAYQKSDDEDSGVVLREKKPNSKRISRLCAHKISHKKPLIILFHGIGNSADIWWHIIKCLVNKGFEVVAPDMLGHGYSSAPDKANSYAFHNLLIHAITIFDHYVDVSNDPKRKCILIGHSYG